MSTPQCSLIVYLHKDLAGLKELFSDLQGFFGKFPIPLEILCVIEKGSPITPALLQQYFTEYHSPYLHFTISENRKNLGRAQSLAQAFANAKAPYLCPLQSDLSVPLGDILKLLQNLIGEEHIHAVLGDRFKKKESSFLRQNTARARTENLFRPIFLEKTKSDIQDPLCESFVLKKETWLKLAPEMTAAKGWYLAPALHQALRRHKMKWLEIFIHDNGKSSGSYVPWKQKLRLFSLSLKN